MIYEKLLAVDPATMTGWAYWSRGVITSGIWDLSIAPKEPGGNRLMKLWRRLEIVRKVRGVDVVAFEQPGDLQGHAKRVLPALVGSIELWCALQKIPCYPFAPTQIKRHATGDGRAKKLQMVQAAELKWPGVVKNHNQADALWLLDLARISI